MSKQVIQVKHLRYQLTRALERMMTRDPVVRPFVIVEHESTERFVQFCGSAGKPLLLDIPALQVQVPFETVTAAVLEAEHFIKSYWHLALDEPLMLTEDENGPRSRQLTQKAKELLEKLGEKIRSIVPGLPEPA